MFNSFHNKNQCCSYSRVSKIVNINANLSSDLVATGIVVAYCKGKSSLLVVDCLVLQGKSISCWVVV